LQGYCNASEFDLPLILSISGFATAITGDIPFAAALSPVISELSHMPRLNLSTLAQALALGTDIGGDATLIGVSTNLMEASWLFVQK